MTLVVNDKNIYSIYHGDDRIYKVYNGDDLVWQTYKTNQTVFESGFGSSGSINLLTKGYYDIIVIGAGGGGCGNGAKGSSYSACSGAAGGSFVGRIYVEKGTINYTIGTGGSKTGGGDYQGSRAGTGGTTELKFGNTPIVTCTGGTGGLAYFRGKYSTGTGGTVTQGNYITGVTSSQQGSNGTGGQSSGTYFYCEQPIEGIEYGAGGYGMGKSSGYTWDASNGQNGYIKIVFVSEFK